MNTLNSTFTRLAHVSKALSWKSKFPWMLAIFICLGCLGNIFKLPLFFGVDFLFGSVFTLFIAQVYGVSWGVIATFAASLYTFFIWGHPYAIVIFTLEALFVGLKLKKNGKSLLILDSVYWIFLGMPLVFIFYGGVMQIPLESVFLIMVKQAINGMFNALTASILLEYTPLAFWANPKSNLQTTRFQYQLLSLLVCCMFLPLQISLIVDSRQAMKDIQTKIPDKLELISAQITEELQSWNSNTNLVLSDLADLSFESGRILTESDLLRLVKASISDVLEFEISQETAINTPGLVKLDEVKRLGENKFENTIFELVHQVPLTNQQLPQGTLTVKHSLTSIQASLMKYIQNRDIEVILIDEQQKVLTSLGSDLEIGASFDRLEHNSHRLTDSQVYHWLPNANLPLMKLWRKSFYIQKTSLANFPFQLVLEVSAAPYIDRLQAIYLWGMSFILGLMFFAVFLAQVISKKMVKPILELSKMTTSLPSKILNKRSLEWPKSHLEEVRILVANFLEMTTTLDRQFDKIKDAKKNLEERVEKRTYELEVALKERQHALSDLESTQLKIVQSEKMSALGNLVAGVAHEINNPVGFIGCNLEPAQDYVQDLLGLIDVYQQENPTPSIAIEEEIKAIDLDFVREDLPKLMGSMKLGVERIGHISTSLRTFSRTDKEYKVSFNLHDGIDSTLLILKHRLKANEQRPKIEIVKEYGNIPEVQCFPGQLNQVFMNLIANAIDALEDGNGDRRFEEIAANPNRITIATEATSEEITIEISDNGVGMSGEVRQRIFEQGFTTKAVGKGTGLGMAIARQIVEEKHGGTISCTSEPGIGTQFAIALPVG
ncbi:hypothetical protein IQ235_03120 [Oscillatoriales cyanobacterium LEGE 11467]|uniref:histidine kinase n=1 Tax=Zarconia navalis LEGE 11467 TaxID=1828826 RepID=A0A928VSX1_9CYAN|nr:hypothetical protein [Zarconia navalis LEGE 11467]